MQRVLALALVALASLPGCDGADVVLVVDLKTDYMAGRHFFGVRTELRDPDRDAVREREDTFASAGDDFLRGQRIAELRGLERGPAAVRVMLLDARGATIASRTALVTLTAQHALTVLVTSSCEGVTCPGAADDPTSSACLGGRCVDPRCSPQSPEFCGEPGCAEDADCASPLACASALCTDGECFLRPEDARCGASELCDVREGCVLRPDVDAGPSCPARESECSDGLDEDCDGEIDCADADCLSSSCDDGTACTSGDTCAADGACLGEALACDDANPCTDDGCDPVGGCTATNNTASCDDGSFCNGPDRCAGGACAAEGPSPCARFCNDVTMACEECAADSDCGIESYGTWSACGGFTGVCGESGSRSRSVSTPRCVTGACTAESSSQSEVCARDTDLQSCGSTSYTSWTSCGSFSGACDTSGTQSRTRTDRICAAGACTSPSRPETRACTRTVADGTSCGTTWQRCCGGACTNLATSANCGGCGVSCTAIGRTCASTGTGGYSCRGCTNNAECRSILDGAATCFDVAAPPAWCQCQCPVNGVCANGGCGAGMFCHDCAGTNYCAPFGGSC